MHATMVHKATTNSRCTRSVASIQPSTLSNKVIARAYERDPLSAAAEYGGEFRADVDAFVNADIVAAAVFPGRHELMPFDENNYAAFCDAAGGSGTDSFTLCIAHRGEDDAGIVDCVREYRPPFSPANVVKEIGMILESYRITRSPATETQAPGPQNVSANAAFVTSRASEQKARSTSTHCLCSIAARLNCSTIANWSHNSVH